MTAKLLAPVLLAVAMAGSASAQNPRQRVYVGEEACRPCHHQPDGADQFSPWRLAKHAQAFAALSMPESRQIADLSGIGGDPTRNRVCLGCHTTAYDTEEWERDDTFHFEDGVQCELCHGPGSEYMGAEVMRDTARARQAGLRMPREQDCLVCHTEKGSHSAVLGVRRFSFQEAVREIGHPGAGRSPDSVDPPTADTLAGPKFVGALACNSCHGASSGGRAYGTWRMSRHADAYASLGTPRALEIARQMGVTGDPQRAEECLECHTTGGGEPAGRVLGSFDPAQGVQCESCHGPGSEYMTQAVMLDLVASAQAGLAQVDRNVCNR
ncbi:MAG: cytochrome c family protein, partial [Longimicrobiales bacterium]|nr:cytochrome c family protein [Longimicrobiales bacterium]